MKGEFKLVVLLLIKNKPKRACEILTDAVEIYNKKPSNGYLYPILEDLEVKEYIEVSLEGKRRVYNITYKGKDELKRLKLNLFEKIEKLMKFRDMLMDYEVQ